MDENKIKQLERNLTLSAKKAKKFWVRGLTGYTEADQGFFDVLIVPVYNEIKNKETTLGEFLSDLADFKLALRTLEEECK